MLGANQKSLGISDKSRHQSYLNSLLCQSVFKFGKNSKKSAGPRQKWTATLSAKEQKGCYSDRSYENVCGAYGDHVWLEFSLT